MATPPGIDTHSHLAPASYLADLRAYAPQDEVFATRNRFLLGLDPSSSLCRPEVRLAEMDEAGIRTSLLSLPPPAAQFGTSPAAVAQRANDELLTVAGRYPGRFAVLMALPLPDVGASVAEIERLAPESGVAGIGLLTTGEPWSLDHRRFAPVFSAAADAGCTVVLHPALDPLPDSFAAYGIESSLGPVLSSSVGALRMIHSGLFDELPHLRAVVPHLGGVLPYLAGRIVDLSRDVQAEHDVLHYCRHRLYFDTCSFHRPALTCAIETAGVDRIVLGSDYPYRGTLRRAVDDVLGAGLGADDTALVMSGTAELIFRL